MILIKISKDRVWQHEKRLHDDDINARDMSTATNQEKHGKKKLLKKSDRVRCYDKNDHVKSDDFK